MAQTRPRTDPVEAPPPPIDPDSAEQVAAESPEEPESAGEPPQSDERPRQRKPAGSLPPFFEQIASYKPRDWESLTAYVYRTQPLTDKLQGGNAHKYITKYSCAFDPHTLKVEHGSGKYQIRLNQERQDGTGSRTIRTGEIEIEDPNYPPNVPLGEWIDDARNAKWAWAKARLEQRAREQQLTADARMAGAAGSPVGFAQAVKEIIELVRPGDKTASNDKTVSAVVDAMKQSHAEAFQMFQTQQAASDPAKLLELVAGLLEKLVPKKPAEGEKNPFMEHLLEEMREMRKENRELAKELREEKAKPQPDTLAQLGSLAETLEKVDGLFGGKRNTSTLSWREVGLKSVELLADRVVPILPALLAGRPPAQAPARPAPPPGNRPPGAVPGGIPPPPPQPPPGATAPATPPGQAAAGGPSQANPPADPAPGQPGDDEAMQSYLYYRNMIYAIIGPLLNHLNQGLTGLDFGDWFVAGYNVAELDNLNRAGRDQIMLLLRNEAPIWQQLAPFEARLITFIDEFLGWTPEEPGAADDDEPGQEPDQPPASAATITTNSNPAPPADPVSPKAGRGSSRKKPKEQVQ